MSEEEVVRKTVSLDPELYESAEARMKRLKYKKFSRYIADLIAKDVRERGPLTVVRDEGEAAFGKPASPKAEGKDAGDQKPPRPGGGRIGFTSKQNRAPAARPVLLIPPNRWDGNAPQVHRVE
jgi:hypothetical protein